MTFSFFHWECPRATVTGGPILGGIILIGLGVLCIALTLLRGTRVRGAFSRLEGSPATATHRVLFFLVGAAAIYEGAKEAFLCR